MAQITAVGLVKKALGYRADSVSKNKAGNVVIRKGYFYRNGVTSDSYALAVEKACLAAGIKFITVSYSDVWKPFRGGASIANQSHFYVELQVTV